MMSCEWVRWNLAVVFLLLLMRGTGGEEGLSVFNEQSNRFFEVEGI